MHNKAFNAQIDFIRGTNSILHVMGNVNNAADSAVWSRAMKALLSDGRNVYVHQLPATWCGLGSRRVRTFFFVTAPWIPDLFAPIAARMSALSTDGGETFGDGVRGARRLTGGSKICCAGQPSKWPASSAGNGRVSASESSNESPPTALGEPMILFSRILVSLPSTHGCGYNTRLPALESKR